jgi:serine/threonine protein kinase
LRRQKGDGDMTLRAGTTLSNRYTLKSLIAVGGMGEVWRAEDVDFARIVAVKVLKESATGNDTFLRRFRNEAKNAAGLTHPNIAQIFDYGDHDGIAFLVMEFVDGEPLSSILERDRTIAETRVVRILDQTAQGLAVAHAAGVMHRDIKPGNLLVVDDDHVKITDFGVSRGMDQTTLTATGMVMGTAQYLAPELALGKPATPASDIYALGIIAYEAVVGRRPFTAPNAVDIAIAQVNEPVPPLPQSLSPGMRELIGLLLEKNPRKRPRSADDLRGVLRALTVADAVPTPTGEAPTPRATKRHMPPSVAPREYRPRPDVRRSPS